MAFRPELFHAILHKGDTLDGFPSKKGIVSNKWSTVTVADRELDEQVNEVGKVSDLNM